MVGGAGLTQVFGRKQEFSVRLAFHGGIEDASSSRGQHLGRSLYGVSFFPQWKVAPRVRLFANFFIEASRYDAIEPLFLRRRDDTHVAVSGGASVRILDRWSLEPAIVYRNNRSNLPTTDYDSLAGTVVLRYQLN